MIDNKPFWHFKACSKLDILTQPLHDNVMVTALADPETNIEKIDHDYCLFGAEEALLARPTTPLFKLSFMIYFMLVSFLRGS